MDIKETLQAQRRVLLDLTYRNRLLNVPKRASSRTINVFDELSAEIYRILVVEKRQMTFAPVLEGTVESELSEDELRDDMAHVELLPQPEDDPVDPRGVASRHLDTKLQTKITSEHLQKRLLEIMYDSQLMIEEQGVNVLFLALGQLNYFDPNSTQEAKVAPLVLVPVKLERKTARERFYLKWTEEDPTENLSLTEKLRVEFKLAMPEFPALDSFDYTQYVDAVRNAIHLQPKWRVEADAVQLGFFSFAKLLMFKDLDPTSWPATAPISEHNLVRGLLGEGFESSPASLGGDERLDQVLSVKDSRHVVDCDSSQALAIESIRRGANLVIQGPPGTGKSQTIANVIAAAVNDGKTVLFVAEKMAALEVVKRRLENVGLGAMCLELHSNKTNKRQVLEELAKTLLLGRPGAAAGADTIADLESARSRLNEHAKRLHTPVGKSGLSPFRILGELSRRAGSVPKAEFELKDATSLTPSGAARLADELAEVCRLLELVGDPKVNPWRGVAHPPTLRPMAETLIAKARQFKSALDSASEKGVALASILGIDAPATLGEMTSQTLLANDLSRAPAFDRQAIASGVWSAGLASLRETVVQGRKLSDVMRRRKSQVNDIAWETDWKSARMTIATHGDSWLRWMNGAYRQALAQLKGVMTSELSKYKSERLALVDDLISGHVARAVLSTHGQLAQEAFGNVWQGAETDWDLASSIIEWVGSTSSRTSIRKLASQVPHDAPLASAISESRSAAATAKEACSSIEKALLLDPQISFGAQALADAPLDQLRERSGTWQSDLDGLLRWLDYWKLDRDARAAGLASVLDAIAEQRNLLTTAVDSFWQAYYLALLGEVAAALPELANFDGRRHDELVAKFKALDRKRIELARVETATAHFNRLPRSDVGVGAVGVLRGEIAKKRAHMALRKLLRIAGSPIQAAKPVFMMSPLSVAQFLEPGAISFDLLVIDEASQVQPVDALGAVARARQLVVVGDDKQLPPTAFFSRIVEDVEPTEDSDAGAQAKDLESILSLCASKGVLSKMLQWHYRSRHESLIAVSNKEFYDGRLFIVPSPDREKQSLGLKLHYHPEGRFDRGSSQKNLVEARAITEAVLEHARSRPDLTLGIGAMSLRQRVAISDELELARRNHPELDAFLSSHPEEPFFVKNLENIQGDERDVVFISIGYAKSSNDDKMYQNFGPLLLDGGHRRLNVLITRARLRCEVFTSILPDEIRIDERSKLGLVALKTFLTYAQTGQLGVAELTGRGADSPFEEAVHAALSKYDLKVDNQVGVAGFFIDLAVVDPESPGRYLLGIECDGAAYHSAPSARDRDRLRQEILEANGWVIHRIWSTDWFQRPSDELKRLLEAVASAKARKRKTAPPPTTTAPQPLSREPAQAELIPQSESSSTPYTEAQFTPGNAEMDPHLVPLGSMAYTVERIVQVEGPVHLDEIVARVRILWGLGRAGSRIQGAVAAAVRHLCRAGRLTSEDNSYAIPGAEIVVRSRENVASRSLKRPEAIPTQEIRQAVRQVVQEAHGIATEDLATAVSRSLGFLATSQKLRERIGAQAQNLLSSGLLRVEDGYFKQGAGAA